MNKYVTLCIIFVLIIFLFLIYPSFTFSQALDVWADLGLYGGHIYDITIDPSNPNKMFAGSYLGDGLFVTEDGGVNWQAVETNNKPEGQATFKDHAVWAVKIAPSNNDMVWVAHDYWVEKSTDGGQTWTHIYNRDMQRDCPNCGGEDDSFRLCRSVAIDPTDPQTVYVGTGGPNGSYTSGTIYKTTDGGSNWSKIGFIASDEFDNMVVDIDIDPLNNNVIWAVTSSDGYGGWAGTLYRSIDAGVTWEIALDLGPWGGSYLTVAAKPGDPNTAFTGSGYGIIKHWYNGGWYFSQPYPDSALVEDISFDPQDSNIVYACWLRPISWGGDGIGKVARSPDGGDTWLDEDIHPHNYDFTSLIVHPSTGNILIAGDLIMGMYKSEDFGSTWIPINNGINAVIVYDVAIDPEDSTHMLASANSGVYEKKGGNTWSRILSYHTRSIQFHPMDNLIFYAGLVGYLAKTTNGGSTWTYSNYLAGGRVEDIAIDSKDTNTIYCAVSGLGNFGKIFKSGDGGDTFSEILDGENQAAEKYDFNTIIIDPDNSQHILAGGGNFYPPKVLGDLWESTDRGTIWQRTDLKDVIVNALIVDSQNPDNIYAGCGYSGGTETPLYKSTDGGDTWNASYNGIPGISISVEDIWGTSGTKIFTAGLDGNILNYDGFAWFPMVSGTTEELLGIWGSSESDIFIAGYNGTILHYDGSTWSPMVSGTSEHLLDIWGSSETDIVTVGHNGTILHYDGSSWTPMVSGTREILNAVWGTSSGTDVFAVGNNGTILYYDGKVWDVMSSGVTEHLESIWGSSERDIFAVGGYGTILHYNGISWANMTSGTTKWLNDIWGSHGTDVFAVGDNGTILYYDGNTWSALAIDFGAKESLQKVWGFSAKDVFFVGNYGGVYHYDGSSWSAIKETGSIKNAVTDLEFHPDDSSIIYAGTVGAGIYVSPNEGENWLNLGTPEHYINAISTSSLFAATEGGLLQCTGTGVIAGTLKDAVSKEYIKDAIIFNGFGVKTISVNGEYMMVSPSGICDVTAIADGYANTTKINNTVLGGDVARVDIAMESGIPDPSFGPGTTIVIPPEGGVFCFIATAAFGSPLAKQIETLRRFRDVYLLSNSIGQKMVALYYRIGKPIAMYIDSHQWLIGPTRIILYPIVGLAWLLISTTAFVKGIIAVCFLILVSSVIVVRRLVPGYKQMKS